MRIEINKVKQKPKNLGFGLCVFGEPSEEVKEWAYVNKLLFEKSGNFTNIIINNSSINELFEIPIKYEYLDGFSPNISKYLHLGHLSNLIIAKSLQSLGMAKTTIAILGDTLDGKVEKEDALKKYNEYCNKYGYNIDRLFFASEQVLDNVKLLTDGEGDYTGTKIFDLTDEKIVGLKSDGKTSYFYQDVALAEKLNAKTLYLTGTEQIPHFASLKKIYPHVSHIGLGLVLTDGKKQSSSEGNVLFMEDMINLVKGKFNGDEKLAWNVLCGYILKYDLPSTKDIKLKDIDNVKISHGLYLSYTLARLKSAGMYPNKIDYFNSLVLQYKLLRTRINISPNILFEELIELCRAINNLYITHHIKDNKENQKMFQPYMDDLVLGMKMLGLFEIERV